MKRNPGTLRLVERIKQIEEDQRLEREEKLREAKDIAEIAKLYHLVITYSHNAIDMHFKALQRKKSAYYAHNCLERLRDISLRVSPELKAGFYSGQDESQIEKELSLHYLKGLVECAYDCNGISIDYQFSNPQRLHART